MSRRKVRNSLKNKTSKKDAQRKNEGETSGLVYFLLFLPRARRTSACTENSHSSEILSQWP